MTDNTPKYDYKLLVRQNLMMLEKAFIIARQEGWEVHWEADRNGPTLAKALDTLSDPAKKGVTTNFGIGIPMRRQIPGT